MPGFIIGSIIAALISKFALNLNPVPGIIACTLVGLGLALAKWRAL